MISIYHPEQNIPDPLLCEVFRFPGFFRYTTNPAEADFFAYPTHYQVLFDYSDHEFKQHGLNPAVRSLLHTAFTEVDELARRFNKRIIVVYLRDSTAPLPVDNAIFFRTSLRASTRLPFEFAFPANPRPLPSVAEHPAGTYLHWTPVPTVGFRGHSAPEHLHMGLHLRNNFNLLSGRLGLPVRLPVRYNFGYLPRRNAMYYLHRHKGIITDFTVTQAADIFDEKSRIQYAASLLRNAYSLCVSGHGNYSFRFYETLRAGRIPVFVDTDCVLPLEEWIDYRQRMVWVNESDVHNIGHRLLQFHAQINGDAFINLQSELQGLWNAFLSPGVFFKQAVRYLQLFT